MSGPEWRRQSCGSGHVGSCRHRPGPAGGNGTQLRVRPDEIEARHLLAHLAILHVLSDRDDFASCRIADDEVWMGWRRGRAIDQVAALDGRSLDADQDAIAWANRIGHIRVVKDIRRAGVIIDGCFHGSLAAPSLAWGNGDAGAIPPRISEAEISDAAERRLVARAGAARRHATCPEQHQQCYTWAMPPSAKTSLPAMKLLSLEARNAATAPVSS